MRYAIRLLLVLAFATPLFSAETSISLDRCLIVNSVADSLAPTKIVATFTLPEAVMGKEIVFAEFAVDIPFRDTARIGMMDFRFCPLLSALPEGNPNYEGLDAITDDISAGSWVNSFGAETGFQVHITEFLRAVALGERPNFGLVGTADLMGPVKVKLPRNLGEQLQREARIRILYKP